MTSTAQQAALEKPVVRVVYFAQLEFKGGTAYLNTTNQPIIWNNQEWIGVGSIGSISQVEESDSLEARPLNFTLNAAQPSWLALAVGPVEEYRGRKAKLYMSPLDESFRLIDTPVLCWTGTMDMVSIGVDGDSGQIVLKCESQVYGLKRLPSLRLSHQQQIKRHPNVQWVDEQGQLHVSNRPDLGLEYLDGLIADPQVWLSKKFLKL